MKYLLNCYIYNATFCKQSLRSYAKKGKLQTTCYNHYLSDYLEIFTHYNCLKSHKINTTEEEYWLCKKK